MKYQQGDVIVRLLNTPPENVSEVPGNVIQQSSHPHTVQGASLWSRGEELFLQVEQEATLLHETHANITIPQGWYSISRIVEVDMFSDMVRPVVD